MGRTADGTFNDLRCPLMGSAGTRFGRNVPLPETFPDTANLMTPNPRIISQRLFTRTTFQPVEILNVMAAAWIQFQTHDWFVHRKGLAANSYEIPLDAADPWPEHPMRVPKTPVDPQKRPDPTRPPAYVNDNSHWWDGSQIYGITLEVQQTLRTGTAGKLKCGADGRLLYLANIGAQNIVLIEPRLLDVVLRRRAENVGSRNSDAVVPWQDALDAKAPVSAHGRTER